MEFVEDEIEMLPGRSSIPWTHARPQLISTKVIKRGGIEDSRGSRELSRTN
jgi:hypothetical protein